MSEPLVCSAIRERGLDAIVAEHRLLCKRHDALPHLVLLKYHQQDSDLRVRLVQECRGLILDESDGWNVVSRPFDKFFNVGEHDAASIDWTTARVQEKLDGSLCTLYHYDHDWHVSTSGNPSACGGVDGLLDGTTYAQLFWRTFEAEKYERPLNTGLCYMFELTSPNNRIVVAHRSDRLTLIGARRVFGDQAELVAKAVAETTGFRPVQSFELQSIEQVVATFDNFSPLEREGYVIVDAGFNRVKCKHPGYVAIHHVRGESGFSERRMFHIAFTNEGSEVTSYYPETAPTLDAMRAKVDALIAEVSSDFERLKPLAAARDRKAFAAQACKARVPGALFYLYDGKKRDAEDAIRSMREEDVASLCGLGKQ